MTAIVYWDRCSHFPVTNDKGEHLFMVTPNVYLIAFALTRYLRLAIN
jgi:hypothetical protein